MPFVAVSYAGCPHRGQNAVTETGSVSVFVVFIPRDARHRRGNNPVEYVFFRVMPLWGIDAVTIRLSMFLFFLFLFLLLVVTKSNVEY